MTKLTLSQFADKLTKILPVMLREFARRQADGLSKGKITLPQFVILNFLYDKDEAKMSDLAHFMGVTTAAMTGLVSRLVKSAYVQRLFDSNDRRIIKVKLTSKGAKLVKEVHLQRRKMIIDIFGKISEIEREDYLRILGRIHQILTKEDSKQ